MNKKKPFTPTLGVTYKARLVFSIGCLNADFLEPTVLICAIEGVESPLYCEAINNWLSDLPKKYKKEGCVYEWKGTFCDFEFNGEIKLLIDFNQ